MTAVRPTAASCLFAAAAVCLLAGCTGMGTMSTVSHMAAGHQPGCRDGACEPHCPVRPEVQGYYATQWRRWPVTKVTAAATEAGPMPAGPPRSVVPGPDEESAPGQPGELPPLEDSPPVEMPQAAPFAPSLQPPAQAPLQPPAQAPLQPPAQPLPGPTMPAVPPEDENLFESRAAQRRLSAISSRAAAARLASTPEQQQFTRELVDLLLAEHDGRVRARIVTEAATFQTSSAAAICRGAPADPDADVRAAACEVWRQRGGPEAARILTGLAEQDPDLGVRLRAVRGLGEIGDEPAVSALTRLLDDPDPAVQLRVCRALSEATGLRLGDDPAAWRRWADDPEGSQRWSLFESLRSLF